MHVRSLGQDTIIDTPGKMEKPRISVVLTAIIVFEYAAAQLRVRAPKCARDRTFTCKCEKNTYLLLVTCC